MALLFTLGATPLVALAPWSFSHHRPSRHPLPVAAAHRVGPARSDGAEGTGQVKRARDRGTRPRSGPIVDGDGGEAGRRHRPAHGVLIRDRRRQRQHDRAPHAAPLRRRSRGHGPRAGAGRELDTPARPGAHGRPTRRTHVRRRGRGGHRRDSHRSRCGEGRHARGRPRARRGRRARRRAGRVRRGRGVHGVDHRVGHSHGPGPIIGDEEGRNSVYSALSVPRPCR